MFSAPLTNPSIWRPFFTHSILLESLEWISNNSEGAEEGVHQLGQPNWFVNVHRYATQPREACVWENHTRTVDIQYIIDGVERIDFAAVDLLGENTLYKLPIDSQTFSTELSVASHLLLHAGEFAVFFPGEAHRPKIAANQPSMLRKLVVKIPINLVSGAHS